MDCLAPVVHGIHKPVFVRGNGCWVHDAQGVPWLDMAAGQFCSILGHSHPAIASAVCRASVNLQNTSTHTVNEEAIQASENMRVIARGMDGLALFLCTGAEAVECAIRHAKHLTKRSGVVHFKNAWHGLTLGTESISIARKHVKPHIPGTSAVLCPRKYYDVSNCLEQLRNKLKTKRYAAAIFEPIVSSGGMIVPPVRYFEKASKLCRKYGTLLVLDECQTGIGRTGLWFRYEHLGVVPDILVCGKGMGFGYPLSAVVFKSSLVPEPGFEMQTFTSHQNDPFGCAVFNAGLDFMQERCVLEDVNQKGEYFLKALKQIVPNARGAGLMLGFDVDDGERVVSELFKRNILVQSCNANRTIRLLPPYTIRIDEMNTFIAQLRAVLN